jgi:hypothetical protein
MPSVQETPGSILNYVTLFLYNSKGSGGYENLLLGFLVTPGGFLACPD